MALPVRQQQEVPGTTRCRPAVSIDGVACADSWVAHHQGFQEQGNRLGASSGGSTRLPALIPRVCGERPILDPLTTTPSSSRNSLLRRLRRASENAKSQPKAAPHGDVTAKIQTASTLRSSSRGQAVSDVIAGLSSSLKKLRAKSLR